MSALGDYIKKRRQALQAKHSGFSIRSVAKALGIHHSYLSKLERGEHAPLTEKRIMALARHLGENPDVLLALNGRLPERVVRLIKDHPGNFISCLYSLEHHENNTDTEPDTLTKRMMQRSSELEELNRRLRDEIQKRKQLQQELQAREGEQRTILNNLNDTIVLSLDKEMNILWMNQRIASELKTSFEEMAGKICFQALHGYDHSCPECTVYQAIQTKEVQEEPCVTTSDGQKWIMRSIPILDVHQEVYRVVRFGFNITKLETTRQALEESELRWKFALKVSQEGVWDWDIATDRVYFSSHWKEMLGYGEHEIGDHIDEWKSRIHPEDYQHTLEELNRHLQGEQAFYDWEHRLLCKDKSYKWIRTRVMVFERDAQGHPERAIGTNSDVTKQKLVKQVLKESEEKHRILYNKTPAMLQSIDPQDRLITVSDYWLERMGYTRGEVIGRPFVDFLAPGSQYCLQDSGSALLAENQNKNGTYQMRTKKGEVLDVIITAEAAYDTNGRIKFILCCIHETIPRL
jgi:PAS domain S-box-containing protein